MQYLDMAITYLLNHYIYLKIYRGLSFPHSHSTIISNNISRVFLIKIPTNRKSVYKYQLKPNAWFLKFPLTTFCSLLSRSPFVDNETCGFFLHIIVVDFYFAVTKKSSVRYLEQFKDIGILAYITQNLILIYLLFCVCIYFVFTSVNKLIQLLFGSLISISLNYLCSSFF